MTEVMVLHTTVIEVIRAMGYQTSNELDWLVGKEARRVWFAFFENKPGGDNQDKTAGRGGNHYLKLYPYYYIPRIQAIVRMYAFEAARQPDLFESRVARARAEAGEIENMEIELGEEA